MGAPRLYGRDRELADLESVLGGTTRSVLLVGEAGIGKSALLSVLVDSARSRSFTVLESRPNSRDTALPYVGLRDAVGPLWPRVADALPGPQRRALAAALLLEEAPPQGLDRSAVGLATLAALDAAVADGPVLLVLDDVHWLDASSALVLAFAARRAGGGRLLVASALRLGPDGEPPLRLRELLPEPTVEVVLSGLELEASAALVEEHAGPKASRAEAVRLGRLSGGNPLHAFELARALRRRKVLGHDPEIRIVPASLRALLDERIDAMPGDVMRTLTIAAALSEPDEQVLRRLSADADRHVAAAQQAGLVRRERGEVVFSHPLLGERLYERLVPEERRLLHARVADVASTAIGRAWHLALAAPSPDEAVARQLDDAARAARAQGAPDVAARLAEFAMRLTLADNLEARVERALAAADHLGTGGEASAAWTLLAPLERIVPSGPLHARLVATMVWNGDAPHDVGRERLRAAADEAAADPAVEAAVRYWFARALLTTATLAEAEPEFRRVESLAARTGLHQLRSAASRELCAVAAARGERVETDSLERLAASLPGWDTEFYDHPDLVLGFVACWSDQLDRAERLIGRLLQRAQEAGQQGSAGGLMVHLAEVRIRQGRFVEAEDLARRSYPLEEAVGTEDVALYVLGHALAHLGRHQEALAAAEAGAALCRRGGSRLFLMQNLLVLGFLAVSTGRWDDAVEVLTEARETALASGYRHPGLFRWDGDLAEALVAIERTEEAESILKDLATRANALGLEVPSAVAHRAEALRLAATGDLDAALVAVRAAVTGLDPERAPFDAARTHLVLGTIERRCRHRAAARRSLHYAAAEFTRMGAVAWAARASDEMARTDGGPAGTALSQTERRVCELAAAGRRNREIAAELFLAEKTVESHLSSAYRKLGVRSRAQLAHHFHMAGPSGRTPKQSGLPGDA